MGQPRRFIWFHLPTVLVVGLLPLLLLSALWLVWHRDAREEQVRRLQGTLVHTLAATLQERYHEHARQVAEVARRVSEQKLYRRPEVLQKVLEHAHGLTGGFALSFHDPSGLGTAISRSVAPRDGRSLRVNISQRPWFRELLEKKTPVVTSFARAYVTGAPIVTFASPVVDGDRVVGVITLVLELRDMAEGLEAHALPRAGHLFLLDPTGTAFHVDPATGKFALTDWRGSLLRSWLAGAAHGVRRFPDGGRQMLVSWATVPAGGVVVGVQTPIAEIAASDESLLAKGVLVATVLLISLSLVMAVVSGRLARRELETLRGYLRGLASASRERPPATPRLRVRELAEVATDARAMADAIKLRQEELEVFHALDHVMAGANEPQEVVRLAVRAALSVLGFDAAAAFMLDDRPPVLRLFHEERLSSAVAGELRSLALGDGVLGRLIRDRHPLVLSLDAPAGVAAPALAALKNAGFLTLAATPFVAHGQVYGLLSLLGRERLEPSAARISLLASVGTEIGIAAAHAIERERLVAQDRLAALGRLAAGTAHELRNPLTVIMNRTCLLKEDLHDGRMPAAEDLTGHVAALLDATHRMTGIVEGLLTYARPPKPEPALLDVVELVSATWQLIEHETRKHYVDVIVDVAPGVPRIMGDRSQLMQVLLNLATNAIEAMSGGEGHLTLRVRSGSADGRPVVLVDVSDTGPGIPSAILPRIWEPFFTTKSEGTGLGLSIVRGLVADQPGASIAVATETGRGTTFTLTFPAVRDA